MLVVKFCAMRGLGERCTAGHKEVFIEEKIVRDQDKELHYDDGIGV
jgi:hypothetical protein